MDFKQWIYREFADFGFEDRHRASGQASPSGMPEEDPKKPINAEQVMTELNRLPPIGPIKGKRVWKDNMMIEWGDQVGAVKVDISPFGSYKIIARRKVRDLVGEDRWICKHVFPLNERDLSSLNETSLAHKLYETVQQISHHQIERAEEECPIFEKICWGVANKSKVLHPEVMLFRGMKQINENHYTVIFEYRGHGVEAPNGRRCEQFHIDITFDPRSGLVRSIGYEVSSPTRQHLWQVTPSEWNEYFAATQDKDEIVRCIHTLLRTY